jgi:hypothetical protein
MKPDIPNTVGKNLAGDAWIIVPTWRENTNGLHWSYETHVPSY